MELKVAQAKVTGCRGLVRADAEPPPAPRGAHAGGVLAGARPWEVAGEAPGQLLGELLGSSLGRGPDIRPRHKALTQGPDKRPRHKALTQGPELSHKALAQGPDTRP